MRKKKTEKCRCIQKSVFNKINFPFFFIIRKGIILETFNYHQISLRFENY